MLLLIDVKLQVCTKLVTNELLLYFYFERLDSLLSSMSVVNDVCNVNLQLHAKRLASLMGGKRLNKRFLFPIC